MPLSSSVSSIFFAAAFDEQRHVVRDLPPLLGLFGGVVDFVSFLPEFFEMEARRIDLGHRSHRTVAEIVIHMVLLQLRFRIEEQGLGGFEIVHGKGRSMT